MDGRPASRPPQLVPGQFWVHPAAAGSPRKLWVRVFLGHQKGVVSFVFSNLNGTLQEKHIPLISEGYVRPHIFKTHMLPRLLTSIGIQARKRLVEHMPGNCVEHGECLSLCVGTLRPPPPPPLQVWLMCGALGWGHIFGAPNGLEELGLDIFFGDLQKRLVFRMVQNHVHHEKTCSPNGSRRFPWAVG